MNSLPLEEFQAEEETAIEWDRLKYKKAYSVVLLIEETLQKSLIHWRTKSGKLLRTLDEVINAILADELAL